MRSKSMRICFASMFVVFLWSGISHAMTKEDAALQWDAARGGNDETAFLMNFFLNVRLPGAFPHTVKKRFYEIATPEDARILLEKWVDPKMRKQHPFAETLLRGLKGDEFTPLFEEYLYIASKEKVQRRLYTFIIHQNSLSAFRVALKYIYYVHEKGLHDQAIFYIKRMRMFKHPEIRRELIEGAASESSITRAVSYIALKNYPDDEVMEIIDDALGTDTGFVLGEENRALLERHIKSGKVGKSLIQDILNETKRYIERERKLNKNYQDKQEETTTLYPVYQESSVSSASSDQELAEEYAPQILLSYGSAPGVDLEDANYFYTDYIPMYVNNVTKLDRKTVYLNLAEAVTYQGTPYGPGNLSLGHLNDIGDPVFRSSANYLDFSPAWLNWNFTIEQGYKALIISPSVYFKVFRDVSRENPIAVQYWFFYYYNNWLNNHPGDWETITVFLDADAEAKVAIYSTHYEANKYSWDRIETVNVTHPKVYVSNGGHGSYSFSDETTYSFFGIADNHEGDKEVLNPDDYYLLSLSAEESTDDSWIWFEGRWGDEDSAPHGPHLRTDTPTSTDWERANNPPYNPEKRCAPRYGEDAANIYGTDDNRGPWRWASGYGLDEPWENENDCKIQQFQIPPYLNLISFTVATICCHCDCIFPKRKIKSLNIYK